MFVNERQSILPYWKGHIMPSVMFRKTHIEANHCLRNSLKFPEKRKKNSHIKEQESKLLLLQNWWEPRRWYGNDSKILRWLYFHISISSQNITVCEGKITIILNTQGLICLIPMYPVLGSYWQTHLIEMKESMRETKRYIWVQKIGF